jgi:DNA-binding CsgD family transcriptional regulator
VGGPPLDISVTSSVLPGRHLVLLAPTGGANAPVSPAQPGRPAPTRRPAPGPTGRERQILAMLADGDTDVQVAAKLKLSPATVQTHVRNAKAKLGARTRAQAVAMALRDGLIDA